MCTPKLNCHTSVQIYTGQILSNLKDTSVKGTSTYAKCSVELLPGVQELFSIHDGTPLQCLLQVILHSLLSIHGSLKEPWPVRYSRISWLRNSLVSTCWPLFPYSSTHCLFISCHFCRAHVHSSVCINEHTALFLTLKVLVTTTDTLGHF